jgi:hypothetical protein
LVVGSTIAPRIRISHFDDMKGPCNGFEVKTLEQFSSVYAQVHNHFNQERNLASREVYKQRRSVALAKWRILAA